jgi:uncharacterized protein
MVDDPTNPMNPDLLHVLRCPLTHSPLKQDGQFLVAQQGGLRYPIRDGIPVLLVEEAVLPPPFKTIAELKARLGLAGK